MALPPHPSHPHDAPGPQGPHDPAGPPRSPTATDTPKAAPARRRRRRGRAALVVVLALGGAWVLVTRSFVTRWAGQAVLTARLGVPVTAESITLGADGTITARGLTVRSGTVEGEAGRFARADEVVVRTPWWRAAWGWAAGGGPEVRSVEVHGLVVRVSQSVEDGAPNIPAFRLGGSGGAAALPTLEITGGRFELGEHGPAGFRALRTLDMAGRLSPGAEEGSYAFDLRQPGSGGLTLKGTLDATRVRAALSGLELEALKPEAVPAPVRELFRKLDMAGRVSGTTFEYAFPPAGATAEQKVRAIEASIGLEQVAVTLPFEDLASEAPAGQRYPRLSGVDGRIVVRGGELTGELKGKLEDLPYTVTLAYHGPTLDAPFEAEVATEGFRLESRPRLLPFLPPIVHKRLQMFSNPSGVVDSRVVLSRAKAGEAPKVSGTIQFRDGVASFVRFPYEFRGMDGLFEFDDNELRIVRVTGRSPSGAEISTHGRITPLTDEAAVSLDITVTDVPVDERLAEGLGPRRRGVLEALFNTAREQELRRAGLIVTEEEHARRQAELRAARERLARLESFAATPRAALDAARAEVTRAEPRAGVPAFALGGRGRVHMTLETPFGRNMPWTQVIEIEIPAAGLLPRRFPLPILARDVRLLVDDTVLSVRGGSFSALRGGDAVVHANADFSSDAQAPRPAPGEPLKRDTDISITAKGIPFDDLLVNAIPAKDRPVGAGAGTLGDVLRGLRLEGAGDAEVWIGDVAPGEIGFRARVSFAGATCAPTPGPLAEPTMLERVGGTISVTDESLELAIGGRLTDAEDAQGDPRGGGELAVDLRAAFPTGAAAAFDSTVSALGFDTRVRAERAIALFSPQAGATVRSLRDRYDPQGRVDLKTRVIDDGRNPLRVSVEASHGQGVAVTYAPVLAQGAPPAPPARVRMGPWEGSLVYRAGDPGTIEFKDLASDLSVGGAAAGRVALTGRIEVSDGIDAGGLGVLVEGAHFESPLTRAVMAERLSPEFAGFLHDRNPRGVFDVAMRLDRPGAAERGPAGGGVPWQVAGELTPRSLAIHGETVDVEVPRAEGTVKFSREGGTFEGIHLTRPDWSVALDGGWTLMPGGASALQARINGTSQGLPPTLMSLLPQAVRDLASATAVKAAGVVAFDGVDLSLSWPPEGKAPPAFKVSGLLGFSGAEADVGVLLTDAEGSVRFESARDGTGRVDYRAWATLPRARAAGVVVTDVAAFLKSGDQPGETLVPTVQAACHGGWVVAEASLKPADPGNPDGDRAFQTRMDLSGVRLAGVLGDFSGKPAPDAESATIDGNVTLGGVAGSPQSRRGRGTLSVGGGAVLDMPVMLPLIQVSNLKIPGGERLDTALASFYVSGTTVAVERLSVLSPSIELRGFGTVGWPEMDLNLVFNSRSNDPLWIIGRPIEWLRDGLITTVVRGTAKDPKIGVEPFRTARQMFTGLLAEKTEADLMMSGLESRSNDAADRRRVVRPPSTGGQ